MKCLPSTVHILNNINWISIKLRARYLKHVSGEKPAKSGFFFEVSFISATESSIINSRAWKRCYQNAPCAVVMVPTTVTQGTSSATYNNPVREGPVSLFYSQELTRLQESEWFF